MQLLAAPGSLAGNNWRDTLLLEQLPHVKFIARRIHEGLPQHIDLEDLVHAGILGLLDALNKFDRSRNIQFKSYAQFRIRGAILDNLRELDWGPRQLRKQGRRIEDARASLAARLGRYASEEELAHEAGLSLRALQSLARELRGLDLMSLQAESSEDSHREDVEVDVADSSCENPYELCAKSELNKILRKALSELPQREGQILTLYYFEELTMKQIGVLLGVVESRISQMHAAVMVRLRLRLGATRRRRASVKRHAA
jgi:RNA polymerase sigma factor for flagellar operon FliA